jgi:hypothetical protein
MSIVIFACAETSTFFASWPPYLKTKIMFESLGDKLIFGLRVGAMTQGAGLKRLSTVTDGVRVELKRLGTVTHDHEMLLRHLLGWYLLGQSGANLGAIHIAKMC